MFACRDDRRETGEQASSKQASGREGKKQGKARQCRADIVRERVRVRERGGVCRRRRVSKEEKPGGSESARGRRWRPRGIPV